MSLWKRGIERSKEIKKSEALCKRRDELMKKWPDIEAAWSKEDEEHVRKAAEELAVVSLMQSKEKILRAKEILKRAIWRRDGITGDFQGEVEGLNGEIETLNGCIIFSKAAEWQKAVAELREKKIVQKEDTRHTMDSGVRITYSSNLDAVARAKEKLIESIKTLRLMRLSPLGEILKFIERVESELGVIDFTVLKRAEEEVTERYFDELCQGPEVTIYTTATLYSKANGQIKISKNYDLPQREFKTE